MKSQINLIFIRVWNLLVHPERYAKCEEFSEHSAEKTDVVTGDWKKWFSEIVCKYTFLIRNEGWDGRACSMNEDTIKEYKIMVWNP
jgi:hypothetical protein